MTVLQKKQKFTRTLFAWHKKHYREMAWRNTHDPYRILISEIMLQQTQVQRVRVKYAEFLKKFSTVRTLARAPLGDVLRVWSGLGYNRRAKYLHECAKQVVGSYGGKFPDNKAALESLPGIGLSTSAALLAFAFGHDEPMIDTNIRRILSRVFFPMQIQNDKALYEFAKSLIPKGKGRDWNYAMLDLGATLCTARSHSALCPMGMLHGTVEDFVYKKPQKKFADSDRFYRGRILSRLVDGNAKKAELEKLLPRAPKRLSTLLEKLIKEKLVVKRGAQYMLP